MLGMGSMLSGKFSPEILEALADVPEQGKQMAEAFRQSQISNLPKKLPKEFKDLIDKGVITKDQLKEV